MESFGRVVIWALVSIFGLAFVTFCWSNWTAVTVSLSPFPWTFTELPLCIWLLGMFVMGSFVGIGVGWFAGHDGRKLSAERRRRIKELEKQLAERPAPARQDILEHRPAPTLPPSRDAA